LETVGLLILPKSRLFETSPSVGQGFARNSPVRVWPSWPCQERRDRIDDEGKRDEGERGWKGERKKPKGTRERERERNAWELNHVVGRLAREISRCESTHTYTETIHVPAARGGGANETAVHVYTTFRGHEEFQKESRAR